MFNLKQIRQSGDVVEARVEPWMANEVSFDIKVNIRDKSIVYCSIAEDTMEYGMFAKKARNKLYSMVKEAEENGSEYQFVGLLTHIERL